jgi:hypothetical protein
MWKITEGANMKLVWLGALLILISICGCDKNKSLDSAKISGMNDPDQSLTASTTTHKYIDVKEITATSFLKEKSNYYAYHPWKAIDGDPGTAWNEGVTGAGIGESLIIRFDQPVNFDRLEIMPGFYDEQWYKKNNRIKKLEVKAGDFLSATEMDDGMTLKKLSCQKQYFRMKSVLLSGRFIKEMNMMRPVSPRSGFFRERSRYVSGLMSVMNSFGWSKNIPAFVTG